MDFPGGSVVENPPANEGDTGYAGFSPWVGKMPWRRKWPTPVLVPGKSHGQMSLRATVHGGGEGVRDNLATETNNIHSIDIDIYILLVLFL